MLTRPNVAIVLVNWNGGRDTIECLASLRRLDVPVRVLVADNASTDNSIELISAWARGHALGGGEVWGAREGEAAAAEAGSGAYRVVDLAASAPLPTRAEELPWLTILKVGRNGGFAAGNNAALRYLDRCDFIDHFWLLNNDTIVEPNAVSAFLKAAEGSPETGIWGSKVNYYHDRDRLQVAGGCEYDWASARATPLLDEVPALQGRFDYVAGCSMFVSRRFIEDVGLMNEDLFLYFEEIDWSTRAPGKWKLGYVPDSGVYHKEGASIGSSAHARPSDLSLRYITRNRLFFTRYRAPQYLPSVRRRLAFEFLVYLKRRDFAACRIILGALAQDLNLPAPSS